MSFFKRLLIVVWVPLILAVSVSCALAILPAIGHGGNDPISTKGVLFVLPIFLSFSFGYCLVPSLVAWGVMGLVWNLCGPKSHQRVPSQLMGAILGLFSGAVINGFVYTFGFWSVRAVPNLLTGLICGLVVATLIRPKPALAAPSESGASLPAKKEPIFWRYLRRALLLVAGVLGSFALLLSGFKLVWWWESYLPSEQYVQGQFADHRNDFEQFVAELKNDPTTRYVDDNGQVSNGIPGRIVPKYKELCHRIGAMAVSVGEDGSIEFEMWGIGGAIMSDSYMGIRYGPVTNADRNPRKGWVPTMVKSLDESKLPHENGGVATGLYVVPIEPRWYVYRLEYQE